MTIKEVIESGKNIKEIELAWYSQFTLTGILVISFLVSLAILFLIWGKGNFDSLRVRISFFLITLSVGIFIIHLFGVEVKEQISYDGAIEKWKIEVAKPFIESLPKEKKEIVYIKIDPELSPSTYGTSLFGTGYTYSTTVERTPLVVSYKDNGIVTRTNWFEASMNLTSNEKPYIGYQILERDLGHGVKAGTYNTQIFLPETYTFTDIK
jgi:hypothetical protein